MSSRALSVDHHDESDPALSAEDVLSRKSSAHAQLLAQAATAAAAAGSALNTALMDDTVIVAEFSEHEGPVPLDTFPSTVPAFFDLNSFVVRTLSADYQRSSDPASIADDSQVVFHVTIEPDAAGGTASSTQSAPAAGLTPTPDAPVSLAADQAPVHLTAFVHHFTLYDVHARGYVRPVCMSYVTLDPNKIMDNFTELLDEFSKVSALLKTANQLVFLADLSQRLVDLRFTRDAVLADSAAAAAAAAASSAAASASLLGPGASAAPEPRERGLSTMARETVSAEKLESSIATIANMQERLRAAIRERLRSDRRLREHFSADAIERHDQPSAPPQLLTSLHKIASFEKRLRSLKELSELAYAKAVAHLIAIQRYFSVSSMTLALQRIERSLLDSPSMMLAYGGVCITNFAAVGPERGPLQALLPAAMPLLSQLPPAEPAPDQSELAGLPADYLLVSDDGCSSEDSFEDAHSCCDASAGSPPPSLGLPSTLASPSASSAASPSSRNVTPKWHLEAAAPTGLVPLSRHSSAPLVPVTSCTADVARYFAPALFELASVSRQLHSADTAVVAMVASASAGATELLRFRRLSWAKHAVYSLLIGRPVLVLAEPAHARQVRAFVAALALFVPGLDRTVHAWLSRELRIADLADVRLAGHSKALRLARSVRQHVTLVDYEGEELSGPPCESGVLVDELLGLRRDWVDVGVYVAHVHSVLMQLGLRAMLVYYLCCVGVVPAWLEADANLAWLPPDLRPRKRVARARAPTAVDGGATPASPDRVTDEPGVWRRGSAADSPSKPAASSPARDGRPRASTYAPASVSEGDADPSASVDGGARERPSVVLQHLGVVGQDVDIVMHAVHTVRKRQVAQVQRALAGVAGVAGDASPTHAVTLNCARVVTFRNAVKPSKAK